MPMDLASYQRALLGLVKGYPPASDTDDAHLREIARSENLKVVHDIILLWQIYVLERSCPLTTALLKRRSLFVETVRAVGSRMSVTAYREKQTLIFLEEVSRHEDSLIRSVAQFEYALLCARQGDPQRRRIRWEVDPAAVLSALIGNLPLPETPLSRPCEIVVSPELPDYFQIVAA
jgi:hypothetical protein